MGWVTSLLEILNGIVKSIPILDRWFTKTPSEKLEDSKEEVREGTDEFVRTGRPPKP